MLRRGALLLVLLGGCTAIRPLDPIDVDAARGDAGLGGIDAGDDAAVPIDAPMIDAGHDAAIVDAFTGDALNDANCPPEVCGGGDEDCDGMIDEADAVGTMAFYDDADGDGYGDDATLVMACMAPITGGMRWVTRGGDCDDTNRLVRPGRGETCDGLDNDCNGLIDDGTTCGFGCMRISYGGHTYQVCGDTRTETNAASQCTSWGYHLADIGDMAENDAVAMAVARLGLLGGACAGAWIGTMRTGAGTMSYVESDGTTPATFFAWDTATGEPNGTGPCVRMRASNGLWGDLLCSQSCGYVCEAP